MQGKNMPNTKISPSTIYKISIITIIVACLATIITVACSTVTPKPEQRLGSTGLEITAAQSACSLKLLKGTYSFSNSGFAPTPPDGVIKDKYGRTYNVSVSFGPVIPLQALGQVEFDGDGNQKGYIHENVGGIFEADVPFKGNYTLLPGPNGVGCTGEWVLQDQHRLYPFTEEGPHFFRIVTSRSANGFHYMLRGGGPGPAVLDGFATLDK